MENAIKSFKDLKVWQEAHGLVLEIYEYTKIFPKEECFGLTQQLRRASVSISSNIAEGFNRKSSKEKIQFYYTALGSLNEVQNQLFIAKDVAYLEAEKFHTTEKRTILVSKLLNGLIKAIQSRTPLTT
jgi:four helix bundle protein